MPTPRTPIVDGHLDLAENVTLFGRDLTASVQEIRAHESRSREQATVSLPEMSRGGIAVAIATVTAGFLVADVGEDFQPRSALYSTPEEAEAQALRQIDLYRRWEREARVRLILSSADLEHHLELWHADGLPGLVLLMEGADPIVRVSDLGDWWRRGLRIVGLTFGDTRYGAGVAGGSAEPKSGGLTDAGVEMLAEMAACGFAWDVSHLTEEGIWQGLEAGAPRVCASHANAQALTPTNRHLSDPVIAAIAARRGVIGVVLYNRFLEPAWRRDGAVAVTVEHDVRRHIDHIAGVAGWSAVGIGSDLDGGLGREESPQEIETIADLGTIGSVVPDHARAAVLGENWLSFLRAALP
jgi:membrane dipeptidase